MVAAEAKAWSGSWPEGVPTTQEYPEIPLQRLLTDAAAKSPEAVATMFFNRTMSYGELDALSDRVAVMLQDLGVQKGDRVALFLPNCPQFVFCHFGILKAGAITVPFNPTYKEREIRAQLRDCGAKVMIALDIVYEPVHRVRDETPLERVLLTSIVEYMPGLLRRLASLRRDVRPRLFPNTDRLPDLLGKAEGEPTSVPVDPKEDVAVLLYTGGTTGVPKGVMLTHYNQVANAIQAASIGYYDGPSRVLAVLPYFHTYGMTTCLHAPLSQGGSIVLLPQFHIKDTLKAIQRHRPTHFPGVPTMYVALLSAPNLAKYDLKSVRYCVSGAAPLPQDVARRWKEVTGAMIVEGYGLTETSPVTHANPMDDWAKVRFGSIGIPLPDTAAKIVDLETGEKELPPGERGELVIAGPQVMKGYWNRAEETAAVLRDGWFHTGDIAEMDESGYFHIVDRKTDMIIVGGFNVYPGEVEEALFDHEAVKLAAVVGVPDEFRGEVPKAYVVLEEGYAGKVTEADLLAYCEENLSKAKVPQSIEFRDELPITLVGKVLRRELREEEGGTA